MSLRSRFARLTREWALKRQGLDPDPVTLTARRIYIVPTRLGLFFAAMLFAMLLGAMNYGNNLALALAFVLGALALVTMHHCHRNLAGLRVSHASTEPVFAGQLARFQIALENLSGNTRYDLVAVGDLGRSTTVTLDAEGRAVVEVHLPAAQRGLLRLDRFGILSTHPFGLFRAWAVMHMNLGCVIYPRPGERGDPPQPLETDVGGAQDIRHGDEDFAGLRSFHPGDSPRRIAWKVYARGQGLQVKLYAGTAVASHVFDWSSLPGLGVEARLSRLCRWIEDAHAAGRAYGLNLPGTQIPPNVGRGHRQKCLTALALFEAPGETR